MIQYSSLCEICTATAHIQPRKRVFYPDACDELMRKIVQIVQIINISSPTYLDHQAGIGDLSDASTIISITMRNANIAFLVKRQSGRRVISFDTSSKHRPAYITTKTEYTLKYTPDHTHQTRA